MAPDDILKSVDESRREFLKKVIAGTAFAVPLMASFSMEGLSIGPADAQLICSNATSIFPNATTSNALCANAGPFPPCCELAEEISALIGGLICLTGIFLIEIGASPVVKSKLFRPLAKALEEMAKGMDEPSLDEGCVGGHSRGHYKAAQEDVTEFFKLFSELCGPNSDVFLILSEGFADFLDAMDALIKGQCEDGFIILDRLTPLTQRLRSRI